MLTIIFTFFYRLNVNYFAKYFALLSNYPPNGKKVKLNVI